LRKFWTFLLCRNHFIRSCRHSMSGMPRRRGNQAECSSGLPQGSQAAAGRRIQDYIRRQIAGERRAALIATTDATASSSATQLRANVPHIESLPRGYLAQLPGSGVPAADSLSSRRQTRLILQAGSLAA